MASSKLLKQSELKTLWDMVVEHPFVESLIAGDLPHDKFRDYIVQDKLFCQSFRGFVCSILADCHDAEDFELMHKWISHLQGYGSESAMFRGMFEALKIDDRDLRPYPTTEAFCNFLWRVSSAGTPEDKLVVLYAVQASYMEWARRAVDSGPVPSDPIYAKWIDIHSPKNLKPLVDGIAEKLDTCLGVNGEKLTNHHIHLFKRALQYEVLFWDTALKPGSSVFPGEFGLTHPLQRAVGQ